MGGSYKGKKLGGFGDAAAFSFFPSKNLGAFGDGGMVVTNDHEVADLARMLRAHGSKERYVHEMQGYNSRLDEVQAAVLRVRLAHLDESNRHRREVAARYSAGLAEVAGVVRCPAELPDVLHVFHQYTIRVVEQRDRLKAELADAGIGTVTYYPVPVDRQGIFASATAEATPESRRASLEVLSLPMGPAIASPDVDRVIEAVRRSGIYSR